MDTYILPFWKKLGTSSSIIAKRVSEKLKMPTSHTGTLDPMAEGVVKIIVGDDSRNKEKYISEDKTYHFKFLFGFSTDTHDGLGLIKDIKNPKNLSEESVIEEVKLFKGKYHQKYPNFSSKKIQGKSLWQYEREGLKVPEIFIDGEIKNIEIIKFENIESTNVLEKIKNQISYIFGNFRQSEILNKYSESLFPEYFKFLEIEVVMTRGLYVRGLARDLGDRLNYPCIILDLVRIKDGDTEIRDCLNPLEYFKEEIEQNKNFLNPLN